MDVYHLKEENVPSGGKNETRRLEITNQDRGL